MVNTENRQDNNILSDFISPEEKQKHHRKNSEGYSYAYILVIYPWSQYEVTLLYWLPELPKLPGNCYSTEVSISSSHIRCQECTCATLLAKPFLGVGWDGEGRFMLFHKHIIYILVNIPVEGIKTLRRRVPPSKRRRARQAFCSGVVSAWCRLLRKSDVLPIDPLTFSKKNPSRAIPRSTYTHPPSLAKIRQRTSEE